MSSDQDKIFIYQGIKAIGGEDGIKSIKQKIAELSNVKNVSFLLGAGASSGAIPSMKVMQGEIASSIEKEPSDEIRTLYQSIDGDNLERKLTILHARKSYLEGITKADNKEKEITQKLIKTIEKLMYEKINIELTSDEAKKA